MTSGPGQQTARVNVDDERWREFRILAIEADRSIADYLGQLVVDELRRSRKRKRRTEEKAPPVLDDTNHAATRKPPTRSMRLADAQLLTELPRPVAPSRRSSSGRAP
jgi:hypothetical protein